MLKDIIWKIIIILFVINTVYSFKVDETELKQTTKKPEFINYTGKYTKIIPEDDIRKIGYELSAKRNVTMFNMTFRIINVKDDSNLKLLSADIFVLEKNANIDHIRNIRRIISAYLEKEYQYSRTDADTLALFISYYNAVYRGNIEFFRERYIPLVISNVNKDNVGISINYKDWPGKTRMIIPLSKDFGPIDTSAISDKATIESVKKEENLGLDERKKLVEIKEKEVETKEKEIAKKEEGLEQKKKELTQAEKDLETIKKDITEMQKTVENIQKNIEEEKKRLKETESEEEKKKIEESIKQKEKDKEAEIKKVEDKTTQLTETTKKTEELKENIKKEEAAISKEKELVEEKKKEIAEDKKEIKKDELTEQIKKEPEKVAEQIIAKTEEMEKKEKDIEKKQIELEQKEKKLDKREDELKQGMTDPNVYANKLYYLKVIQFFPTGHYNSELYKINANTMEIEAKAPVSNIVGRKFYAFSEGIVLITYDDAHISDKNFLTLLDRNTLKIKTKGTNTMFWRSEIEVRDNNIYAIVMDIKKNRYYLGKFNINLECLAVSSIEVSPDTFISILGDQVYITSKDGEIVSLDIKDLKEKSKVKP